MKNPPVVAIQGGLGNQLFQWFFAHELRQGSEFSIYPKIPTGPVAQVVYELGLAPLIKNCSHFRQSPQESKYMIPKLFDFLWRFSLLTRPLHLLGYFRENPRSGTRAHQTVPRRLLFANGYFQKWQYAKNQIKAIETELLPVLSNVYADVRMKFDLEVPYTVIHVRRGDYRTDQNPETMIGSLDDTYFINWAKQHPSKHLVLLAEHRRDVEDLIKELRPALVLDNTQTSAWETLAILGFADTLLGSNSTLTWWGAWVASMNGGKVFLPSQWDVMGRFNISDFLFPDCQVVTPVWENFSINT